MKIIVTGGAGFIGSSIVDAYINEGHEVAVIDNLETGKKSNLHKKAKFYKCDIRDRNIERIFATFRPEILNHHAAQIDVRKSVHDPVYDADVNVLGTLNLLRLSVKYGIKKFLFASSGGAVYGEQKYFPADENHPVNPVSAYGTSKLCAEKYLKYFNAQYGLNFISLRYSNVYGPRQDPLGEAGVVAIFINKLLNGEEATIYGDGLQTRDFVFISDVVSANLKATESDYCGLLNIGTGKETSIRKIYALIAAELGKRNRPNYGPARPGEQRRSSVDSALASSVLGWRRTFGIKKGISKTIDFFYGTSRRIR